MTLLLKKKKSKNIDFHCRSVILSENVVPVPVFYNYRIRIRVHPITVTTLVYRANLCLCHEHGTSAVGYCASAIVHLLQRMTVVVAVVVEAAATTPTVVFFLSCLRSTGHSHSRQNLLTGTTFSRNSNFENLHNTKIVSFPSSRCTFIIIP